LSFDIWNFLGISWLEFGVCLLAGHWKLSFDIWNFLGISWLEFGVSVFDSARLESIVTKKKAAANESPRLFPRTPIPESSDQ
jgi:hypothetical protein